VKDYRAVRNVALALTVIGFLLALAKLGTSEFPSERSRAQSLAAYMAVLFVLVAGDRIIVNGVADWFNISPASLPPFWR
jgi:divalent metal cation (Fe/Co/Zn/Cd) transporter